MTYCFDLDGTLCSHEEDYAQAKPFEKRIDIVNNLYRDGHIIVIDTARGSTTGIDWFDITESQLKRWGVSYHTLRVGSKIGADVYIDDKAINDKDYFQ